MKLDLIQLDELRSQRLVTVVDDAASGLSLANYTAKAQYDQMWDTYPLLLDCRGLIFDRQGLVVAKPLRKFFNVGERPETQMKELVALGAPEISCKLDGSLGILFYSVAEQTWRIATRGSFTSDQAVHATQIWQGRYGSIDPDPRWSYLFEIIYPGNRVVVDYGSRDDLVLIGLVETETGMELAYASVRDEAKRLGLHVVDIEEGLDWSLLHEHVRPNFEGYVLFWPERQVRVKVKLTDYVRLHRLIMGLSEHTVWEMLREDRDIDALRREVPEEILPWLDGTVAQFTHAFTREQIAVRECLQGLQGRNLDPQDRSQRKEIAAYVIGHCPAHLRPALFLAVDGKNYGDVLWRFLEPQGTGSVPALVAAAQADL
jgi:RNA ligase